MTSTAVIFNDPIPLVLTLLDGSTIRHPQAVLTEADGTLIGTVDLTHQANGIYVNAGAAVLMPNTLMVNALFIVYNDAGHTEESSRYVRSVDTFTVNNVNVKKQNDAIVYGIGTPANLWRGYP